MFSKISPTKVPSQEGNWLGKIYRVVGVEVCVCVCVCGGGGLLNSFRGHGVHKTGHITER